MTNNYSLNNLTAQLHNPTILNYCRRLLNSYTTDNSTEQFETVHNAVRENFPEQLTIETSNNIIIVENYFHPPLYVTSLINPYIRFAFDCSIQSKTTNEQFRARLYSDIFKNHAQGTPYPFGLNDHEALKRLSDEQFNNLINAIKQTVNNFIKAVKES